MPHDKHACCGPTPFGRSLAARRDFLRLGLAGFTSLSLPGLLRLQASAQAAESNSQPGKPREKSAVIMVWKPGGCSHLDTYDPKPGASSDYRGPFATIPTQSPGPAVH